MRPSRCSSIKGAHLPPRGKPPPETEMNRSYLEKLSLPTK
ncbi:hypothetical protein KR50_37260 [Jeotgalibacillus campisalis]|uniref:Uncharacterized protein n=1 Tax=Jeotgalibacillus campisalis TaxID=220754 RepID=A0A0C2VH46_9BACL|nr:hypothetical protein KR50_37260 [Jeotgalibacillus campisalis]